MELYFCVELTENEHWFFEEELKQFCNTLPDTKVLYYRKLKDGHIPCLRETKIVGNIWKIKEFIKDQHMENYIFQNPYKVQLEEERFKYYYGREASC